MAREIEWEGTAFTDTMLTVSARCVNEEQRVLRMLSPRSGPELLSTGFGFTEPGCNTVGTSSLHLMKIFHQETKIVSVQANATSQPCEHHDFSPPVTAGTVCFLTSQVSTTYTTHG